MASFVEPVPHSEQTQTQRAVWLAQLHEFMCANGTPIERLPAFDRDELDVYALYYAVTQVSASDDACMCVRLMG